MVRQQLYLTDRQKDVLSEIAKEKDVKLAELIRRILDEYIDKIRVTKEC